MESIRQIQVFSSLHSGPKSVVPAVGCGKDGWVLEARETMWILGTERSWLQLGRICNARFGPRKTSWKFGLLVQKFVPVRSNGKSRGAKLTTSVHVWSDSNNDLKNSRLGTLW